MRNSFLLDPFLDFRFVFFEDFRFVGVGTGIVGATATGSDVESVGEFDGLDAGIVVIVVVTLGRVS